MAVKAGLPTEAVLAAIVEERERQEEYIRSGRFAWTCADPMQPDGRKLCVLVEEVGEVSRALLGEVGAVSDGGDLRAELVHVAAVAVAWLEALDS